MSYEKQETKPSVKELLFESDWLASTPFFYDLKRGVANTSIQELTLKSESPVFHPEGLYNYLDFGYSVFEQTPLADVRFLHHSSRLWRNEDGMLEVEYLEDPFDRFEEWKLSESDVIELIRERVQAWEAALPSDQEVILPLSGGFDSRLLLWCLKDPSRVRAYTYGISNNQNKSTEVVFAQELSKRYGVRWEQITLGNFHQFFDEWHAEFGVSTHAHGMYHFEFYSKIRERLQGRHAFLSGIFGDVWAGSILPNQIDSSVDLVKLAYTHGLRADPSQLRIPVEHEIREGFWKGNGTRLQDHCYQTVTTIRLKIMLISYLMRVPRLFDFQPWSPYLDIDVAMAMLNLPQKRRTNRQWQIDFFTKVGLDLENQGLKSTNANNLDIQALRNMPLMPLDRRLLSEVVDPDYIDWINQTKRFEEVPSLLRWSSSIKKVGGVLRKLQLCPDTLKAYSAYQCLKPIESILK